LSRIGVLLVVIAALTLMLTVQASAATAPAVAPLLTSPVFASPVTIQWAAPVETTAAGHGEGPGEGSADDDGKGSGHGSGDGDGEGNGHGNGKGDRNGDGGTASLLSVLRADGPCGSAAGARTIATFTDPATSNFSDPVTDGTYCYSIKATDDSTTAVSPGLTVVVGTRAVAATTAVGSIAPSAAVPPVGTSDARDTAAPPSPAKLGVRFARRAAARVPVTVRWTNPAVPDLDRVELVLNGKRPPRSLLDGRVVYRGLEQSFVLALNAGQTAHLALYAIDKSGNISAASRRLISLAALIPMRPLTGSAVHAAPLLRWEPRKGAAYYNIQIFHRGKRVLVAWPQRPSYRFPAEKLAPGTYVWFVWPALARTHASPRFDGLIGRATFTYVK
jgi:hypothetical protein